jgi:hypothetical protein
MGTCARIGLAGGRAEGRKIVSSKLKKSRAATMMRSFAVL